MYSNDNRVVMTLDAGGTNFVFSAIQANEQIIEPIRYPSNAENLELCLDTLAKGFTEVLNKLDAKPVAISFAFPGPADYNNGIIYGYLPNFPSFRNGVPLASFLNEKFNIPVFINNDGDLFAYGEAIAGALPLVNKMLADAKSSRKYNNLIGVTFGTGFGCGVVVNNQLLLGDNSNGGNVWSNRNKKYPEVIIEESVSIRAVKRVYSEVSGDNTELTPKDIFDIAEGTKEGDINAAKAAFSELGELAGDTLATSLNLIDGLIVIGGGLAGAERYIIPAMVEELNAQTSVFNGDKFSRLSLRVIDIERNFSELENSVSQELQIPHTNKTISFNPEKITGVTVSKLGASLAISIGAYAYALNRIDTKE